MAKKQNNGIHYEPGIIYDLGILVDGTRTPFYVGETSNPEQRLKDHQRAGKNADDDSTLVYQTIKAFDEADIAWDMKELDKYGDEGPTGLEDEWIMRHLYDGYKLTNMKKGNANWMAEREAAANDMRNKNIRSYKKYKEVLTQEDADRKHAKWMAEEELRKQKEAKADRKGLEEWQAMLKNDIRLKKQKEERKQVTKLVAEQQAENIRQREIERAKEVKRIARAQAAWEADRPARETRIKAETERLQVEEQRKQQQAEERRQAYNALQDQAYIKFLEQANKNYVGWPEDIREYHQRTEDAEVKLMISQGLTDDQIAKYLERDKKLHWPPARSRV